MIIRKAELTDLERCLPLFEEFKAESLAEYGMDMNVQLIRETVQQYIGTSFVAEIDGMIVGILAGTIVRNPTCSTPIYQEQVWYVTKTQRSIGIRLFKTVEAFALAAGCKHMIMAHMLNSKADKLTEFYTRLGFVPFETHYIKPLTGGNNAPSSPQPE